MKSTVNNSSCIHKLNFCCRTQQFQVKIFSSAILFFALLLFSGNAFGQLANVTYSTQSNSVVSNKTTGGSCADCEGFLCSSTDWEFYSTLFTRDDADATELNSGCRSNTSGGTGNTVNYNSGFAIVTNRTNASNFIIIKTDIFESDGDTDSDCVFDGDDDCRCTDNNIAAQNVFFRRLVAPSNGTLTNSSTFTCASNNQHTFSIKYTWKYAAGGSTLTFACGAAQTVAVATGDIRSFSFAAIAGQTYRFTSLGGSTLRIYGTDGFTLAQTGTVSVDFTPGSTGTYYAEFATAARAVLTSGFTLSYQLICPSDGNPCTNDCTNGTCQFTNNTASCSDGITCTDDICSGGACVGTPNNALCTDGNVCTDDVCTPPSGCVYTNNTAPCQDGNACTENDICAGGSCQPGTPVNCDDGDPCTSLDCLPASGCTHAYLPPSCSISASPNDSICEGGSVTFTATGGTSYSWSTGVTTDNITVSAAGTYSVTVTNADGCTGTCSETLVIATPSCNISGDNKICFGTTTTFTASGAGTGGSSGYSWSTGATTNTIITGIAGPYSVTVTNYLGCTTTCSITLTVDTLPVCSITGADITCDNTPTQWTAHNGSSYSWSGPNGFSAATAVVNVIDSGTYTVIVTDGNGCTSSCTKHLANKTSPTCDISGNQSLCPGGSSEFIVTSDVGISYSWSGPGGFSSTNDTIGPLTTAGTYSVTVTSANGCTSTCSRILAVNSAPTCNISGGVNTVCEGITTNWSATSGMTTYAWMGPNSFSATTQTVTVGGSGEASEGTYTVVITNANGCKDTCSRFLTVNPLPVCSITGNNVVCQGQTTGFRAHGGTTYLWSRTGGGGTFVPSNTSDTLTFSNATTGMAGTYNVTATLSGCTSTCSRVLTVHTNPTCSITGGTTSVCPGFTTTWNAPAGMTSYTWSGPSGFTNPGTQSITIGIPGTYGLTIVDGNGCTNTNSCTRTLNFSPVPSCGINGATTICSGTTTTWTGTGSGGGGGSGYSWSTGATTTSITVSAAGTYTVTVTNSSGCKDTCQQTLNVITDCNDNNACTVDGCSAGACTHTTLNCNDHNGCTIDDCDVATGCTHDTIPDCDTCAYTLLHNVSIYSENFTYTNGTTQGSGSPPKWTIVTTGTSPSVASVQGNRFQFTDLDGQARLITQVITISGYSNVSASVFLPTTVNLGSETDTIRVHYKLNGGVETPFTTNGVTPGNYTNLTASVNVPPGPNSTLQIVIRVRNQDADESHYIDNIVVTGTDTIFSCNDGNACTSDACNGTGVCVYTPIACNDNNVCTVNECNPGTGCVFTTTVVCNDNNACTSDACIAPATGCQFTDISASCNDANPCTDDGCDVVTGCFINNDNTNSCTDNSACTVGDACVDGTCVPGAAPNCDDSNPCTDDSCVPATGCVNANNTLQCTDGNACTAPDICGGGSCQSGAAVNCDDSNPCTTDGCDPGSGCTNVNVPDNTSCPDDGNLCTQDFCVSGTCTHNQPVNCDDGEICTLDGCEPATGCTHDPIYFTGTVTISVCLGDCFTAGGACQTLPGTYRDTLFGGNINGCDSVTVTILTVITSCDDSNVCTDEVCTNGACQFTNNTVSCNDNSACTDNDVCGGGSCAGSPITCDDANSCTANSCNPASGCIYTNNTDGCDDGNGCTDNDVCSGGSCAGSAITCDDANPCTDNSCNPSTGCVYTNNTDACNDDNACTENDVCSGGTCEGSPITCDDLNPCTNNSCNPSTGCVYTNNTNACDDNSACTDNDVCDGGSCAGSPITCDDLNPCTDNSCDPASGCVYTNNTDACDDGNACTDSDLCSGGTCAGSTITCDDANPCTDNSCDPAFGCVYTNNTDACDDNSACTDNDVCGGGSCAGSPIVCDDANPCTNNSCNPATGCAYTNNSASCEDGNACTESDFCSGGECQSGSAVVCNDLNPCTDNSCDPASGCVYTNNTDPCDDNSACTDNDVCGGGSCAGSSIVCDDANPCTDNSCDPASGCVYTNNTDACDDGNACTGNDVCGGGSCAGAQITCDDLNPCTDNSCNPASGCVYTNNTDACDDGSACTDNDVCGGSSCAGSPITCDDLNPCTDNSCNPASGCVYTNNTDACDDGNACTYNDVCSGGSCAGSQIPCDDLNPCTDNSCDPASGCVYTNNTDACDDGSACTDNDVCGGGSCLGSSITCDDANSCTDNSCNPASGCVYANNTDACDDGNACTDNDVCDGGSCAGSTITCDDANSCTDNSCDQTTGCNYTNNTDACDDGNACTDNDVCGGGNCSGSAINCDDANSCTDNSCNPTSGCVYTNNTTACDDGNACTGNDVCGGGSCAGSAITCDDANSCTDNSCDPASGCVYTNNTNACEDGNACTVNDICSGSSCQPGAAAECDDGLDCTDDSCVPASGCQTTPHSCDDGNACTNDFCVECSLVCEECINCGGGALCDLACDLCALCIGNPAPCQHTLVNCDDNNPCTDDACDPASGCAYTDHTGSCPDDGAVCTDDVCDGRVCTHPNIPGCCNTNADCADTNPCTDNACLGVTGCVITNNADACEDGSACTDNDVCGGGSCTGLAITCDDANSCTDNSCNPASGCFYSNSTDACDDGNACTDNDVCGSGSCAGSTTTCDDANSCTDNSCDPASGCVYTNNTDACYDGNACTDNDVCGGGNCAGSAITCDDANSCTDNSCDPASGCVYTNNTTACDDGNACTGNDVCGGGSCAGSTITCDDANSCTENSCNPASGCVYSNTTDACDDDNACTDNDVCDGGSCAGSTITCDDANSCTDNSCDQTTGCVYTNNTDACDDGNSCTDNDACSSGRCAGSAITCDDANPCTDNSCDPTTGCVYTNNSASCEDGNACTENDICSGSSCQSGSALVCNDNNPCTDDACDPASGCTFSNNSDPCDDGSECTDGDACSGGSCQPGSGLICNDDNPCTDDDCDLGSGCSFTNNSASCSDDNACTTGDACSGGSCQSGSAVTCNDNNSCTDDDCNSTSGCVTSNNSDACDDENACTTDDGCSSGSCAGTPISCNDGNECTDDDCNPASGCVSSNNSDACDDGNACTSGDVCSGGSCTGTPLSCNDNNPCTDNSCNPTSGCVSANNTNTCDDGIECSDNDVCSGGICAGTINPNCIDPCANVTCNDGNFCTNDACNPSDGACLYIPKDCSDGNACTGEDCDPAIGCTWPIVDCEDGNLCTFNTCNSLIGCVQSPTSCDDGNACTGDDCDPAIGCTWPEVDCEDGNLCTFNICNRLVGCVQDPTDCDDGNACTYDDCDPASGCTHDDVDCNDNDECTTDDCNPQTGCVYSPVLCVICIIDPCIICGCDPQRGCFSDPVDCDDDNACTIDECLGDNNVRVIDPCIHTPVVCEDFNACTDNSCNSISGCEYTPNIVCDDGNACTVGDGCDPSTGTCITPTPVVCDDNDACTDNNCNSTSGECEYPLNTFCDDGNACTVGDVCDPSTGACMNPTNIICDDQDGCTTDDCDPASGCEYTPVDCADNDICTEDSCNLASGQCVHEQIPQCCKDILGGRVIDVCDDGIDCTVDGCVNNVCTHDDDACDVNPDLVPACPLDIIFVLDESGSIVGEGGTENVADELRNAAKDLLTALNGTGSRVAIIEFNRTARRALINSSPNFQVVDNTTLPYFISYVDNPDITPTDDHYDPEDYNSSEYWTNWEDAFNEVEDILTNEMFAPLVIFFTDGKPTAYNNNSGGTNEGSGEEAQALSDAIGAANAVKALGSHIFIVGLPNPDLPEANVIAVSGPDKYPAPEDDFTKGDYTISSSMTLEDDLQSIAGMVCRADLRLSKSVAPAVVCAGATVTFTLVVTNDGLEDATGVQAKDYLPSGYTYVSDDGDAATTESGGTITWDIGNLDNGNSATLNIVATVNGSGNYTNVAEVTASDQEDYDSDPNNFSGSADEDDESEASIRFPDCDDGSACTRDACVNGECANTPIDCNDQNACTLDNCDSETGCKYTQRICFDNDECTTDACDDGSGCVYTPKDCHDGNACTTDGCHEVSGCTNYPKICNDHDGCTIDDCNPSTGCVFTPKDCNDQDGCTIDDCHYDDCRHREKNCDDDDDCTVDDCVNGECTHTPKDCNDDIECTVDDCDDDECTHTAVNCGGDNPDLVPACPLDIIFVLDESGSIVGAQSGTSDISTQVRSAATSVMNALEGTGSSVCVVEFNTLARRASINGNTGFQVVDAAYITGFNTYMGPDGNSSPSNTNYDPEDYSCSSPEDCFTNWEDALQEVQSINVASGAVPLVLFFTDGFPTAYNNGGGVVTGTDPGTEATALAMAATAANVVKSQGSHMFVIGIPNPVLPEGNVVQISGPDRFPDQEPDFTKGDYSISSSQTLEDELTAIAQLICRADLRLSKSVEPRVACAGSTVVFTVRVTNDGLEDATGVEAKDYLPDGYTYVSNDGGASINVVPGGTIITWSIGNLSNGQTVTLNITATVNASGNHTNAAEVTASDQADGDSDPNNFTGTPNEDDEDVASVSFPDCNDGNPCTSDDCENGECTHTPGELNIDIQKNDMSCRCAASQNQLCLLDFAGLAHGEVVSEQYAAYGIHIISKPNSIGSTVTRPVVFNSNLSGTPDPDLEVDFGNILIIPLVQNSSNPNDDANGGEITFNFDQARTVLSFVFVDQDDPSCNCAAYFYDGSNALIKVVPIPFGGDGSIQTIAVNASGVRQMVIKYSDSGGITDILFDCDEPCCDGSATANVSGGSSNVIYYAWSTGQQGFGLNSISGLCPGEYCVSVGDGSGCFATECFTIENPEPGECQPCNFDCDGVCDGDAYLDDCGQCVGGTTGQQPCDCNLKVESLTLMLEGFLGEVGTLNDYQVINKDALCRFNIRADLCNSAVGSVKFVLNNSTVKIENIAPYAFWGDNAGSYKYWTPAPGNYTIVVTAYSNVNATGTAGTPLVVHFTVLAGQNLPCNGPPSPCPNGCNDNNPCTADVCVNGNCAHTPIQGCGDPCYNVNCNDNNACTTDGCNNGNCYHNQIQGCGGCPNAVQSFTLVLPGTSGDIGPLTNGQVINLATLCKFSVRANACTQTVKSVKFILNGSTFKIESVPPFALAGDANGSYSVWNASPGQYTLTAIPYTSTGASGTAGTPLTVSFSVTGQCGGGGNPCSNVNCNDGNPCTTDGCSNGQCYHNPMQGCCQSNADCNDNDPCTNDACSQNACVHTSGSNEPSYLRVVNPAKSWRKLKLGYSSTSLWTPQQNVTAGGNNQICITLRTVGTPEWGKIQIRPQGSASAAVVLSNYIAGAVNNWTTVCIPLSAFSGFNFSQISLIEIPYSDGANPFEIHIQRIVFTGGTTPFLWFGDPKTNNYHDGQTGSTSALSATLVPGSPCGGAKMMSNNDAGSLDDSNVASLFAYPNPFTEQVTISFSVPTIERVRIDIVGVDGRLIATLFEGTVNEHEEYKVEFRSGNLASGMYFYRMITESGVIENRKLLLVK